MDAAAVTRLVGRPRVLGLGEPTHGSAALLGLRNSLFHELVENAGYRTIALESDCLMGLVADSYATSGAGTLDDAVERGFSHDDLDAGAGNRELLRWMRSYNAERPESEWVHLAGIDGPLEITHAASPRQALTALRAYLLEYVDDVPGPIDELVGDDAAWTNQAAMMDPAASVGLSPEAVRLRIIADDLTTLLETQTPHLLAATSQAALDRARLYARTATGLLRYHANLATPGPNRWSHLAGIRAAIMTANVLALAERSPVLLHAHNSHLQRPMSSMRMGGQTLQWWSTGAQLTARLGPSYAVIATAVGTISANDVPAPAPHTVESYLDSLPGDLHAPHDLPANLEPRTSPWYGYAPLDPAHLTTYDGIIYVRNA